MSAIGYSLLKFYKAIRRGVKLALILIICDSVFSYKSCATVFNGTNFIVPIRITSYVRPQAVELVNVVLSVNIGYFFKNSYNYMFTSQLAINGFICEGRVVG